MRFIVPQNLDVQDTILLGLSFRQIIYLGGALGIATFLFLFTSIAPTLLIGVPVLLLALALSFIKHNNRPFVILLQAFIKFLIRDDLYVWEKRKGGYIKRGLINKYVQAKTNDKKFCFNCPIKELATSLDFDDK